MFDVVKEKAGMMFGSASYLSSLMMIELIQDWDLWQVSIVSKDSMV